MIPADYKDFLVAVVTAAASFIGLLFVAMTLIIDKGRKSERQAAAERIMAESSYVALINIFFVSLVGLVPETPLGYVLISMSLFGLLHTLREFRFSRQTGAKPNSLALVTAVYVFELAYGIFSLFHTEQAISSGVLMILLFSLFGAALARAWELTGMRSGT